MLSYRFFCDHCGENILMYLSNRNSGINVYCEGQKKVHEGIRIEGDDEHPLTKMRMIGTK